MGVFSSLPARIASVAALFAGISGAVVVSDVLPREDAMVNPLAGPVAWSAIPARYRTAEHEVVEGETASEVLRAMNAPTAPLLAAADGRLNRLSVGDVVQLDFVEGETSPWRLRLDKGGPQVLALVRTGELKYAQTQIPVPFTIETGARTLTVTSSLWNAALDAGLRPGQVMGVASIFEYDVDFNTELLPGAIIRLAADTLTDDAGVSRVGDIRAAKLQNGAKTFVQIKYRLADGTVGWFKPDGTGARKPFLRSPLAFSRVTSGFSTGRYHPILKVSRPHLGVDFGAPTGTPVRAVADGVVSKAGPAGGHGNHIELDHEGPYATSYSHLSAILVKRGQTVHQGDLIGRVGTTGLSTGPHLHYQFFVNGTYVNPLTVVLPNNGASELPEAEKAAFFKVRDSVLPLIDG
jgi:murein DD-endopeptidase MepM/ murein hydrolase activator NlpD